MAVYTFPLNKPFITQLAAHIFNLAERDPDQCKETLVLLPSKRACNTLTRCISKQLDSIAQPHIISMSEFVDHPYASNVLRQLHQDNLIKPAISPMKRRLMLTKLCVAAAASEQRYALSTAQAIELATSLASLLDEFQRQDIPLSTLQNLVPEEYALHWQRILQFLHIITVEWPHILESEQLLDPIARRNKVYYCIAQYWQRKQELSRIIIAGSTASNKAVAAMMQSVAGRVNGEVILPAWPMDLDDIYQQSINASHPHYYTKLFIDSATQYSSVIKLLEYDVPATSSQSRSCFIQQSFSPAELAYRWQEQGGNTHDQLEHIEFVEASNELDQARQITTICEQLINDKQCHTICIVSERQAFTKLLATTLDIATLKYDASEVDSLIEYPETVYLCLIAKAASQPLHPTHMLSILKHQAFQKSEENAERALACWLEKNVLRGGQPFQSMEHLIQHIRIMEDSQTEPVIAMLTHYWQAIKPLYTLLTQPSLPFRKLLEAHLACFQRLLRCNTVTTDNSKLHIFLERLIAQSDYLGQVDTGHYPIVLEQLLQRNIFPVDDNKNANIRILPSEEARLETADAVIITDFNEGVWPATAAVNPWLGRNMQANLGLDLDNMRASRMAHDLMMLTHAKHLIFIRPLQDEHGVTIASRWWQRLYFYQLATGQIKDKYDMCTPHYQQTTYASLYRGPTLPEQQPIPMPPIASRPHRFSISDIELLQRDPYSIYAKYILQLKPLDELLQESSQALYGIVLHRILEQFCKQYPTQLPDNGLEQLQQLTPNVLEELQISESLKTLWLPKLQSILVHYYHTECARRPMVKRIESEINLSVSVTINNKVWQIVGRADRIEHYNDNTACVIDYKTGGLPLIREVKNFIASQLPISAWLVSQQYNVIVNSVEYWRFSHVALETKLQLDDMQNNSILEDIHTHVSGLLIRYNQEATPYTALPDINMAPRYPLYLQLERYAEWG